MLANSHWSGREKFFGKFHVLWSYKCKFGKERVSGIIFHAPQLIRYAASNFNVLLLKEVMSM